MGLPLWRFVDDVPKHLICIHCGGVAEAAVRLPLKTITSTASAAWRRMSSSSSDSQEDAQGGLSSSALACVKCTGGEGEVDEAARTAVLSLRVRCRYAMVSLPHNTLPPRKRWDDYNTPCTIPASDRDVDGDRRSVGVADDERERDPIPLRDAKPPNVEGSVFVASRDSSSPVGEAGAEHEQETSGSPRTCSVVDTLSRMLVHERYCALAPYTAIPCRNITQGCHALSDSGPQLQAHEASCRYRTTLCPYGCGTWLPLHLLEAHVANCQLRRVPCEHAGRGCPVQLPPSEAAVHAEECGWGPAECPHAACRDVPVLTRRQLQQHLVSEHNSAPGAVAVAATVPASNGGPKVGVAAPVSAGSTAAMSTPSLTFTAPSPAVGLHAGSTGEEEPAVTSRASLQPSEGKGTDAAPSEDDAALQALQTELNTLRSTLDGLEHMADASKENMHRRLERNEEDLRRRMAAQADLCLHVLLLVAPPSAAATPGQVSVALKALFHCACTQGSEVMLDTLQSKYSLSLTLVRSDDNLGLRLACQGGHVGMLRMLFQLFSLTADDARSVNNQALRLACQRGHLGVVRLLVEDVGLGADDVRGDGCKAVRLACQHGHEDIVSYLSDRETFLVDDVRADGNRALRVACEYGCLGVVRLLISRFELTVEDVRSCSCHALQLACQNGHLPVVRLLVETFQLTREDVMGKRGRALRWAVNRGQVCVVAYLAERFHLHRSDLCLSTLPQPVLPESADILASLPP